MTELSFLLKLLLDHKLPKATKDLIASRIKDVEEQLNSSRQVVVATQPQPRHPVAATVAPLPAHLANQSASTLALMAKHGEIPPEQVPNVVAPTPAPLPVEIIAQTPQAAAAMQSRLDAMRGNGADRNMFKTKAKDR